MDLFQEKLDSLFRGHKNNPELFALDTSCVESYFRDLSGLVFDDTDFLLVDDSENETHACGHIFNNGDLIYRCSYKILSHPLIYCIKN